MNITTRGDDSAERTMSVEQFRFMRCSATTSSAVTPLDSDNHDALNSEDPATLLSKRRRFNSDWVEGRMWLKHDQDNSVIFCVWCCRFDKNEHRNQFVKGGSSMKLECQKHKQSGQNKDA